VFLWQLPVQEGIWVLNPEIHPNTSPLNNEESITLLRQIPLFSELPLGKLKSLARTLNRLTLVEPDAIVFRDNKSGSGTNHRERKEGEGIPTCGRNPDDDATLVTLHWS
jgi:hypothetical protein